MELNDVAFAGLPMTARLVFPTKVSRRVLHPHARRGQTGKDLCTVGRR